MVVEWQAKRLCRAHRGRSALVLPLGKPTAPQQLPSAPLVQGTCRGTLEDEGPPPGTGIMTRARLLLGGVGFCMAGSIGRAQISSTFDDGSEGWTANVPAVVLSHGNPG